METNLNFLRKKKRQLSIIPHRRNQLNISWNLEETKENNERFAHATPAELACVFGSIYNDLPNRRKISFIKLTNGLNPKSGASFSLNTQTSIWWEKTIFKASSRVYQKQKKLLPTGMEKQCSLSLLPVYGSGRYDFCYSTRHKWRCLDMVSCLLPQSITYCSLFTDIHLI